VSPLARFAVAAGAVVLTAALHGSSRVAKPEREVERRAPAVETAIAEAAELASIREGFGRVLDPLPFVDAIGAWSAARRALAYADVERRRVERLASHDRNASDRELEAARLAAERAALDLRAATARMAAVWGADAAARPDLESIAARLASGRAAIAGFDLPAGAPDARIEELRLAPAEPGAPDLATSPLGRAPAADPVTRGRAYLLLVEHDPPPVGMALAARVEAPPAVGVAVPTSAIVWSAGEPLVFVATGRGFERRAIERAGAVPGGWLASHGVAPGERVVVAGAQQLLSRDLLAGRAEE
jgi:hypothetical protein